VCVLCVGQPARSSVSTFCVGRTDPVSLGDACVCVCVWGGGGQPAAQSTFCVGGIRLNTQNDPGWTAPVLVLGRGAAGRMGHGWQRGFRTAQGTTSAAILEGEGVLLCRGGAVFASLAVQDRPKCVISRKEQCHGQGHVTHHVVDLE